MSSSSPRERAQSYAMLGTTTGPAWTRSRSTAIDRSTRAMSPCWERSVIRAYGRTWPGATPARSRQQAGNKTWAEQPVMTNPQVTRGGRFMDRHGVRLALTLVALLSGDVAHAQENWPQWRGPSGNRISKATNLPTTWNLTENVVWKTPLPSWSAGTPVIWGNHIFVTSPTTAEAVRSLAAQERGRRGGGGYGGGRDPGGPKLLLICISRKDGKELWSRELDEGNQLYNKQNSSSPSPVTDGKHVWAVTGTGAVTAFDMLGNKIWQRNLQREYGRFGLNWGYASSPLLYQGKLIIQVLHGMRTADPSYIVAFDAVTRKPLWREDRRTGAVSGSPDAHATPSVPESAGTALGSI